MVAQRTGLVVPLQTNVDWVKGTVTQILIATKGSNVDGITAELLIH